ncbi:MAG: ComEC/Rec2 family competence protein [Christensenellales bacterium]
MSIFITSLKISILSLLVTLPIITNINPDINFLSIFYNILYIPFITYIILPMAFLVAIFPLLECIFNYVYLFFETFTHFFANIKIFTITFPSVNIIVIFCLLFHNLFYTKKFRIKKKNL